MSEILFAASLAAPKTLPSVASPIASSPLPNGADDYEPGNFESLLSPAPAKASATARPETKSKRSTAKQADSPDDSHAAAQPTDQNPTPQPRENSVASGVVLVTSFQDDPPRVINAQPATLNLQPFAMSELPVIGLRAVSGKATPARAGAAAPDLVTSETAGAQKETDAGGKSQVANWETGSRRSEKLATYDPHTATALRSPDDESSAPRANPKDASAAEPVDNGPDLGDTNPSSKSPSLAEQIGPTPIPEPGGMSAALPDSAMQTMQDVNEISVQTGQILPAVAVNLATARSNDERKVATTSLEASGTTTSTSTTVTPLADGSWIGTQTAPVADADATQATHVVAAHSAIENAIISLPRQEPGSVSLLLTTDSKTELSLHVKMEQGHVHAQAVVERGDFAALKAGWSQLQSRLAEHGVRLAPLSSSLGQGTSTGNGSSPFPRRERDVQPENDLSIPPTTKQSQARSSRAPAVTAHRREWWA